MNRVHAPLAWRHLFARAFGRRRAIGFVSPIMLFLWLWVSASAFALDPSVPLNQMRHTVWLAKDGLPSDALRAIEQTHDGYLWLATLGGFIDSTDWSSNGSCSREIRSSSRPARRRSTLPGMVACGSASRSEGWACSGAVS